MSKSPNMKYFQDEALKSRIESFETRCNQAELFIEANEFAIMALKAKLKGDDGAYDVMWQNYIEKSVEAKKLAEACNVSYENYQKLMKLYNRGVNWINNKTFDFEANILNEEKENDP